jgi:myo-inositol-1(or 4)-monophosphatase
MDLEKRCQFGLDLIREAGEVALNYFNTRSSLTVQAKGIQDMASEADMNTELFIKKN